MSRSKPYRKPTYFRSMIACSDNQLQVDRSGGNFGAGVIYNVSCITRGEALGHGMWIDKQFVSQVGAAMLAAENGIKVRFTHPNQSGDGLAKGMGRAYFRVVDGDKVFADIHFWKSAWDTPDGNLAGYVMERASEDPSSFGTSISFMADSDATEQHSSLNSEDGQFKSDDEDNYKDLPHVRLKTLRAVDFVDEPAANPDGLFSVDKTFREAEDTLRYVLGLSDEAPEGCSFGVDPDRVKGFFTRFMETNDMKIVLADDNKVEELHQVAVADEVVEEAVESVETIAKDCGADCDDQCEAGEDACGELEEEVKDEVVEQEEALAEKSDVEAGVEAELSEEVIDPQADLRQYVEAFGAEFGSEALLAGKSFSEAQAEFIDRLQEENRQLAAAIQLQSETEGEALSAGGDDVVERPVGFQTQILGQFK